MEGCPVKFALGLVSGKWKLRILWELTLQLTLEALGFAVVNGAGRFTVTGPDGSARSFDLIRGGPAEKLFLKILFPLDKRE